jgi:hypothetical protein
MNINMKTVIILTATLFITSFAFAETKDELIEKVMSLSNLEADFAEATSRTLNNLTQVVDTENTEEMLKVAREYIRKNNLNPIYATALDETYSEEELKLLIEYYESIPKEYEELIKKNSVDFRVNYALEMSEWRQGLFDEINSVFRNKPTPDTRSKAWNEMTSREKQFYIMGVMDASSYTYYNFYYHAKDSVDEATLKPIILNVHSDITITFSYLELITVMNELYSDPKNQHIAFGEILRTAESKLQGKDISSHLTKLQKQADAKINKDNPNQKLEPTVKTPVE